MIYTNQLYIRIGKEVLKKHPDIATSIIDEIQKPTETDLSKITGYFHLFCVATSTDPETITGAVYKSYLTEKKKIFIGSMYVIYANQRAFSKNLCMVLNQKSNSISRMVNEVKFRYEKDNQFKQEVTNILTQIYGS